MARVSQTFQRVFFGRKTSQNFQKFFNNFQKFKKLGETLGRGMLLAVGWLVLVQIVVVTSREIGLSPVVPDIFNSMVSSLTKDPLKIL